MSDHAAAQTALDVAEEFDADILVSDVDLGSRPDGVELALILRRSSPQLPVVFLTNYPRAGVLPRGLDLDSVEVVSKDSLDNADDLVAIVDAVVRTERAARMRPDLEDSPPAAGLSSLTRSQLMLLRLMAEGLSNDEIARRTGRTTRAVERLVTRTFDSLGLSNSAGTNPRVRASTMYTRVFGHASPEDMP